MKINFSMNWLSLIGVIFFALKITGMIDWSWWWVLAPFWGAWALLLFIAVMITLARH